MAKRDEIIITSKIYKNGILQIETAKYIPSPPNYFLILVLLSIPVGLWLMTMQGAFR